MSDIWCPIKRGDLDTGLWMFRHDYITRVVQETGEFYEQDLIDAIAKIGLGGTFVDVGANIGNHTVAFRRCCGAERVVAIEPYAPSLYLLQTNAENLSHVRVLGWAVHDKWYNVDFVCPDQYNVGRVQCKVGTTTKAATLDKLLINETEITLIKIDVETSNVDALRSGLATIARWRPVLALEAQKRTSQLEEIERIVAPLGYRNTGKYAGTPVYLFRPSKVSSKAVAIVQQGPKTRKVGAKRFSLVPNSVYTLRLSERPGKGVRGTVKGVSEVTGTVLFTVKVRESIIGSKSFVFTGATAEKVRLDYQVSAGATPKLECERIGNAPSISLSFDDDSVTAAMATYPARADTLPRAIETLVGQVDKLFVYLNGYDEVPQCVRTYGDRIGFVLDPLSQRRASAKFYWLDKVRGYHLICDDDILYPADYAKRVVAALDARGREAVIGVHGVIYEREVKDARLSRKTVYNFAKALEADTPVHLIGTATFSLHTALLKKLDMSLVRRYPIANDEAAAVAARQAGVPMICLARKEGWMKPCPGMLFGIYEERTPGTPEQANASVLVAKANPWEKPYADVVGKKVTRRSAPGRTPVKEELECPPVAVVIRSFNRPMYLMRLLNDCEREAKSHRLSVWVFDDASSAKMAGCAKKCRANGWTWMSSNVHFGRQGSWRMWDWMFAAMSRDKRPYLLFLDDDMRLCDRFLLRAFGLWQTIEDEHKGALTLLVDKTRKEAACWSGQRPERLDGGVELTQWLDTGFLCPKTFLTRLGGRVEAISPARWKKQPDASTGVGAQLTKRAREAGMNLYRSARSHLVHLPGPSVMNPTRGPDRLLTDRFVDGDETLTWMSGVGGRVEASLASIPSRSALLQRVVASLLPQVDLLRVYLNGYADVPGFLSSEKILVRRSQDYGDLGATAKFFWCHKAEGYQLICDDDILYPSDYARQMILALNRYRNKAVVGVHAVTLKDKVRSYFRDRTVVSMAEALLSDQFVHLVGTGTVAYHADVGKLSLDTFEVTNMTDIWFGLWCQQKRLPVVAVSRSNDWMQPLHSGDGIYEKGLQNEGCRVEVLNRVESWKIHKAEGVCAF